MTVGPVFAVLTRKLRPILPSGFLERWFQCWNRRYRQPELAIGSGLLFGDLNGQRLDLAHSTVLPSSLVLQICDPRTLLKDPTFQEEGV